MSCLNGLIITVKGTCIQFKKTPKVCKYFHNNVRKICCCHIMIFSILDTDCHPYTSLMKSFISTERGMISMEINRLTNEHICIENLMCALLYILGGGEGIQNGYEPESPHDVNKLMG